MRPLPRAALALLLAIALVGGAIYAAFPGVVLSVALDAEHARLGLTKRRVSIPGGLEMSYLEGGRGLPLVLLHGFGADKEAFVQVARDLMPRYHVFIPDLIGFGESSHPADADYSPEAQADRVRQFCQVLGLPWVHVGGSSMGGQIALAWAAAHPSEVGSLWLLDPAGIWSAPKTELAREVLAGRPNPLFVSNVADFDALLALTMTRPPPLPAFARKAMAAQRRDNRALEERIFTQISSDSIEQRVAGIKLSTLIVFGEHDRIIDPATAQVLKKLLVRGHVVVMSGVGHLPAIEDPVLAASDYVRFRDSM